MPKSCSAFNCTNRYSNKNPEITFHRFPFSKPSVLKQWLDNIGRDDFQPRKHMVICSLHFTPDCFSGLGNRKNLLWDAVPTLFTTPPQHAKQNVSKKKLKGAFSSAADKWEAQNQETHNDHLACSSSDCQTTKDLVAADHTYAILDPCTTKARLFDVLDANRWLQERLQTKCRAIRRMKLKLQEAERAILTLQRLRRFRCTHLRGSRYCVTQPRIIKD